jgi:hypothetical protein
MRNGVAGKTRLGKSAKISLENNYVTTLPLSVLSNALKIADESPSRWEAVENKIRRNSQGWEDAGIVGERQVIMVVAYGRQLYLLPEHRPAKFERVDTTGLNEAR